MTDAVSMESIRTILEDKGYSVLFGPPDKAIENQVSMEIADLELTIETPTLYNLWPAIRLSISTSQPEKLVEKIVKIITDTEEGVYTNNLQRRGSFKFTRVTFSKPGELYIVSVICVYLESIEITT